MHKISVVMCIQNEDTSITKAIESVIKQSFSDFEFIIVGYKSTDKTLAIVRKIEDRRIHLIRNQGDFIESLNMGLTYASGKYIACMDANCIMHIDKLRIQHAIMEENTDITVCGTWVKYTEINPISATNILSGLIEKPLFKFLRDNFLFHPSAIIRNEFLRKHKLKYENYHYAADFKLWTEIAKLGGRFYVDNQPLLYCSISENQVSQSKNDEKKQNMELIVKESLEYLIMQNKDKYPELQMILSVLDKLQEKRLINNHGILDFFQNIFLKNDENLTVL